MQDRRDLLYYMDIEDIPSDSEEYTSDSVFNTIYIPLVVTGDINPTGTPKTPNKTYPIVPTPSLETGEILKFQMGPYEASINSSTSTSKPDLCRCNGIYNCIKWYTSTGYASTWSGFSFCPYSGNSAGTEQQNVIDGYLLFDPKSPQVMNKYVRLQFSHLIQIKNLDTNDQYPIYVSVEEFIPHGA